MTIFIPNVWYADIRTIQYSVCVCLCVRPLIFLFSIGNINNFIKHKHRVFHVKSIILIFVAVYSCRMFPFLLIRQSALPVIQRKDLNKHQTPSLVAIGEQVAINRCVAQLCLLCYHFSVFLFTPLQR